MGELVIQGLVLKELKKGFESATGIKQQKQAAEESRKANVASRRIQDIKAARERRKQVREAQRAQAEIVQGAQASGTSASSGAITGAGSVQSQLASNISFLDNVGDLTNQASIFSQNAADARSKGATRRAQLDLALQAGTIFALGT